MPPVKEERAAATAAALVENEPPADPNEGLLEGLDDGLAWIKHEFRGVTYKLVELPIGEYDAIVTKATRKEKQVNADTGNTEEVEILDNVLQSRLMLKECITEPAKIEIPKLGTRLTIALNRAVNILHYGPEPDALRQPKKADSDGEDKPGNA